VNQSIEGERPLDEPDPLILEPEPHEAFRSGLPSPHLPIRIHPKFRFARVRAKFMAVTMLVALLLLVAAGWFSLERLFANRLAADW
jgi:hypothetical protein